MGEAFPLAQERHKRGNNHECQSAQGDETHGWKQEQRRTGELETRRQQAPAPGVAPASEVCFRVADIEKVGAPRSGERQRRKAVHNGSEAHEVAPAKFSTLASGRAPLTKGWTRKAGLLMTILLVELDDTK